MANESLQTLKNSKPFFTNPIDFEGRVERELQVILSHQEQGFNKLEQVIYNGIEKRLAKRIVEHSFKSMEFSYKFLRYSWGILLICAGIGLVYSIIT
jgi:hypothetical protein